MLSNNLDSLANDLVSIFTQTQVITHYDATTGKTSTETVTSKPDKEQMKKLATRLMEHIRDNGEIYDVKSSVDTTVAPGIMVTTPAGPGTTTGTGKGMGTATQTGMAKIK